MKRRGKAPPMTGCARCGGELHIVAGLRVCKNCGAEARPSTAFQKKYDVPRDSGWKAPLIRDDD